MDVCYLYLWEVSKIKLKRILVTIVLTLTFLLGNSIVFNPQLLGKDSKFNVVYAAPKGSSGGFKSGGFSTTPKSSSPSGGFKSGGFTTTPKSSGGSNSGGFFNTKPKTTTPFGGSSYDSSRRSFFPIPIPIPWGSRGYYGGGYGFGIFSFFWSIIKIIIIIAIILWVLKRFRRR